MVMKQDLVKYPPLESLFDAHVIKSMNQRRVLAPAGDWRPRVHGSEYDQHQDWALGCLLRFEGFLVFADTGLGKTKIALDAIDFRLMRDNCKHALIVTGSPTATYEWLVQSEVFGRFDVTEVRGTPAERRAQLTHFPKTPVLVTDYQTLKTTFAAKQKKRGGGSKFVADREALTAFGSLFEMVVLDEVHRVKNPATLTFDIVEALVERIRVRVGLTGTPFDRHPEDAWAQFWVVDGGETFGNRHEFLTSFFDIKPSYWSMSVMEYRIRKDRRDEFRRRCRHRSIRITRTEAKGIPDVQRIVVKLKPSPGCWEHMQQAKQRIKTAHAQNEMANEFAFLRQLCSGLIRVEVDHEEKVTVRAASSTKIDWVLEKLEELGEEQVVIFYEFRESGMWLHEELTKAKIKTSWLYGGVNGPELLLDAWKKKRTRVLLTQTQMAAESLNLQQAAYLIQYESPLTYRLEKQSLARVGGRIGGRSSVVYTLTVRGSKELRILELIREGKETVRELLEEV